jgi:UDP-GlcNAc3NAcA epimerase
MKIVSIVGARPQFIKLAPLVRAFNEKGKDIKHVIIHTGQHYDYNMSKVFFDELGIPTPDFHLEVGSGEHGVQTGLMLQRIEEALLSGLPDRVIVYGDTNSTLAGALAGSKLHIPVDHVEAGLRSYNRSMPEEINRGLTDHCSSILFCPTLNAVNNLRKEGFTNIANNGELVTDASDIPGQTPLVVNVGDIMYDSFLLCLEIAEKKSDIMQKLGLAPQEFCLVTIHRAENTDNEERLKNILEALTEISDGKQVIFPMHPRTQKAIEKVDVKSSLLDSLRVIEPVSYFDMLILEKNAEKILTDSGGMQKEAYFSRVPCVTLRDETEWVETVASGWNMLTGAEKKKIVNGFHSAKTGSEMSEYGVGNTAAKIADIIEQIL